jgi:hypothetical protein
MFAQLTNGQTFLVVVIAILAAAGTICSVVASIWGSPLEHSSESSKEPLPYSPLGRDPRSVQITGDDARLLGGKEE